MDGNNIEVVEAVARDLAKLTVKLSEGLYVVGSGSTGAAPAIAVLGAAYFAIMFGSSLAIRKPHPSFVPPALAHSSAAVAATSVQALVIDIPPDKVITIPQFHLLGLSFFCIATGGMGMLSVAKPMMNEVLVVLQL